MDPKVLSKLLTHHRRGHGVDVEALRDQCPLRQSTNEGSKMGSKLAAVELVFRGAPGCFRGTWIYIGGRSTSVDLRAVHEAGRHTQGVGAPPCLVASSLLPLRGLQVSRVAFLPKISSVKFQVNWTPFDFPFLRYSKTRKKQKMALGSRLIC